MFRKTSGMLSRAAKVALIAAGASAAFTGAASAAGEVNIYSYRQPHLIQPLLDKFTEATGIKTNVVYAKKGMLERLKAEGANTPADVVLTTDISRLAELVDADLLQGVSSDKINSLVPAHLRDPKGRWIALTKRARIVYASKSRVKAGELARYEDLSDAKWKGRICTRSGRHVYTIGLISSMVAEHGAEWTEKWLAGVKANLARKPQGNDRAQVKAISEGVCDLALGNTYYMGKMLAKPEQKAWADSVNIVFPNQGDRGAHINISGGAVTKHAKRKDAGVKLLEFLADTTAQGVYAAQNYEYPVHTGVKADPIVAGFGTFKEDKLDIAKLATHRTVAAKLVDKVGFDN